MSFLILMSSPGFVLSCIMLLCYYFVARYRAFPVKRLWIGLICYMSSLLVAIPVTAYFGYAMASFFGGREAAIATIVPDLLFGAGIGVFYGTVAMLLGLWLLKSARQVVI